MNSPITGIDPILARHIRAVKTIEAALRLDPRHESDLFRLRRHQNLGPHRKVLGLPVVPRLSVFYFLHFQSNLWDSILLP